VMLGAEEFVQGMDLAFLVSAIISVVGALTSLARGGSANSAPPALAPGGPS
jgi:hypothetical protein